MRHLPSSDHRPAGLARHKLDTQLVRDVSRMHVQMRDTFAEVAGTGERERAAVGRALNQQRARDALRSKHRLDVLGVIAYPEVVWLPRCV